MKKHVTSKNPLSGAVYSQSLASGKVVPGAGMRNRETASTLRPVVLSTCTQTGVAEIKTQERHQKGQCCLKMPKG